MRIRIALGAGAIVAGIPVLLSGVLGIVAARPRLASRLFGPGDTAPGHPLDFSLKPVEVEYADGCQAWWIPVQDAVGAVVIAHGFEPTADPRSTDPAPRLGVAASLAAHRYSALVINLGYASGIHLHSGGELEADDIACAVRWAATTAQVPVAVLGFSAGGHAAVAAAGRSEPFAVVTDSAFVDFGEVLKAQGASVFRLPEFVFSFARVFMRAQTGRWPLDLTRLLPARRVPMLHFHGTDDTAIAPCNLQRIAALTGGEQHLFKTAGHNESFTTDEERYRSVLIGFLERHRHLD